MEVTRLVYPFFCVCLCCEVRRRVRLSVHITREINLRHIETCVTYLLKAFRNVVCVGVTSGNWNWECNMHCSLFKQSAQDGSGFGSSADELQDNFSCTAVQMHKSHGVGMSCSRARGEERAVARK